MRRREDFAELLHHLVPADLERLLVYAQKLFREKIPDGRFKFDQTEGQKIQSDYGSDHDDVAENRVAQFHRLIGRI
jgi:hypothetical protein